MHTALQKKAAIAAALLLSAVLLVAGCRDTNEIGEATMRDALPETEAQNAARLGTGSGTDADAQLFGTDGEFMSAFYNFAYGEVLDEERVQLNERTRHIVILAGLLGAQGLEQFEVVLPAALAAGVTPVEAKEIIYQATAYLGFARTRPFLSAANRVFEAAGIELPLEEQGTVTQETRRAQGNQVQIDVFGEGMRENWVGAAPERAVINSWLASNCFGDYYTRGGLNIQERELITFCFLASFGGCDPQVTSHAAGNMAVGNDKDFLIRAVLNMTPYIGYPRSLNAISCVENAARN